MSSIRTNGGSEEREQYLEKVILKRNLTLNILNFLCESKPHTKRLCVDFVAEKGVVVLCARGTLRGILWHTNVL